MNYFRLKTTAEKAVVGSEYPQIQTIGGTIHRDASNSLYNVFPNDFPNFIPNLDHLVLHKNAKLTDFLSAAMISFGFIVSDKVKAILEEHSLPEHKFYPASVKFKDKTFENYFWFFYISNMLTYIDYTKTSFFITDFFGRKERDCFPPLKNKKDLDNMLEILPGDKHINSEEISFKEDLPQLDLFKISGFNFNTYITDNLRQAFLKSKITGYETIQTKMLT